MTQQTYTESELRRWIALRALEWANWPTFASQPLAPIFMVFFPWYFVVMAVLAADLAWSLVRYRFVSLTLARPAIFFVLLQWPSALFSGAYLLIHHSYPSGTMALFWPLVAMFIQVPASVGQIELAFANKLGYSLPPAE